MTATALSLKYEWCRNASRAWTFEMCTSTNGASTLARASRMATLVCVYAPALMTMPALS